MLIWCGILATKCDNVKDVYRKKTCEDLQSSLEAQILFLDSGTQRLPCWFAEYWSIKFWTVYFIPTNVRQRAFEVFCVLVLSDLNQLSGSVNIFMSIIYMLLQITPLNTSIITVRTFVRFFSGMNSNMFLQFVVLPESFVAELTCKWLVTSMNWHMKPQSSRRFESFITFSTLEV